MSFQPQGFFPRFRESLKHEDHIHNQIEACRNAFNRGDPTEIMYAVESLMLLITPHMEDFEFLTQMKKLDNDWNTFKRRAERDYERKIREADGGCPDLVARPNLKPSPEHFKTMFMIGCGLFERKGLMLKIDTTDRV